MIRTDGPIETRQVLAGAYTGKNHRLKNMLTHSVETKPDGADVRVLCERVLLDSIADAGADPAGLQGRPTCTVCLARDPRFKRTVAA